MSANHDRRGCFWNPNKNIAQSLRWVLRQPSSIFLNKFLEKLHRKSIYLKKSIFQILSNKITRMICLVIADHRSTVTQVPPSGWSSSQLVIKTPKLRAGNCSSSKFIYKESSITSFIFRQECAWLLLVTLFLMKNKRPTGLYGHLSIVHLPSHINNIPPIRDLFSISSIIIIIIWRRRRRRRRRRREQQQQQQKQQQTTYRIQKSTTEEQSMCCIYVGRFIEKISVHVLLPFPIRHPITP